MKISVIVVVIVVVLGLGYFFFLSPSRRKAVNKDLRAGAYRARYEVQKATGALPVFSNTEGARQCRENLARIESAKRAAAEKLGISAGTVPLDAILQQMNQKALPRCPGGGEYAVGGVNFPVKCSVGDNGTKTSEDDHILHNY